MSAPRDPCRCHAVLCLVHERDGGRQDEGGVKRRGNEGMTKMWTRRSSAPGKPAAGLQDRSGCNLLDAVCLWPPFLRSAQRWSGEDPEGTRGLYLWELQATEE